MLHSASLPVFAKLWSPNASQPNVASQYFHVGLRLGWWDLENAVKILWLFTQKLGLLKTSKFLVAQLCLAVGRESGHYCRCDVLGPTEI